MTEQVSPQLKLSLVEAGDQTRAPLPQTTTGGDANLQDDFGKLAMLLHEGSFGSGLIETIAIPALKKLANIHAKQTYETDFPRFYLKHCEPPSDRRGGTFGDYTANKVRVIWAKQRAYVELTLQLE
jgi:hypothetical protein